MLNYGLGIYDYPEDEFEEAQEIIYKESRPWENNDDIDDDNDDIDDV